MSDTPIRAPCKAGDHQGPFEPKPEWSGWLGFEWVHCTACHSDVAAGEHPTGLFWGLPPQKETAADPE